MRKAGLIASLVLAFALVLSAVNSGHARAVTLEEARAQLAAIENETADITAKYEQSIAARDEAVKQQELLPAQIAEQEAKIEQLRVGMVQMVTSDRQNMGMPAFMEILLSPGDEFIDRVSAEASISVITSDQQSRFNDEKERLTELQASLTDAIETENAEIANQKALLDEQKKKETEAKALVSKLSRPQQDQLNQANMSASSPGIQALVNAVRAQFPEITSIGTYRAGDRGDHGRGKAADFMVPNYHTNTALGWAICDWVLANAGTYGVKYLIYQQQYRPVGGSWRMMANRGSDTQNHYDHVHVSLY